MVRTTSEIERFKKQEGAWKLYIIYRNSEGNAGTFKSYDDAFESARKRKLADGFTQQIVTIAIISPEGDTIDLVL